MQHMVWKRKSIFAKKILVEIVTAAEVLEAANLSPAQCVMEVDV